MKLYDNIKVISMDLNGESQKIECRAADFSPVPDNDSVEFVQLSHSLLRDAPVLQHFMAH